MSRWGWWGRHDALLAWLPRRHTAPGWDWHVIGCTVHAPDGQGCLAVRRNRFDEAPYWPLPTSFGLASRTTGPPTTAAIRHSPFAYRLRTLARESRPPLRIPSAAAPGLNGRHATSSVGKAKHPLEISMWPVCNGAWLPRPDVGIMCHLSS
jgi:hypothetical protein